MSVSITKQFGSIMIIVGTEIGAGVLALPIITAKLGFLFGSLVMIGAWLLMTYTAVLVADINLKMEPGTSFGKMAKNTLGRPGEIISWVSFLLLLYAVSVAYISAAASAFNQLFPSIPQHWFSLIFVVVLGGFVLKGVSTVDIFNRFLSSLMLIVFLLVCFVFWGYINLSNLLVTEGNLGLFALSVPVIVTSFTSHLIIPSLRNYLESDPKVIFRTLIIGSTIPLVLYMLWEFSMLGAVPLYGPSSFTSNIFAHKSITNSNVGDVLMLLEAKVNASFSLVVVNAFTDLAVMTSYLGVSMSLYHFIFDGFSLASMSNRVVRSGVGAALTFLLPLLIVLLYPNLFIRALGYVGSCVSILLIVLPVLMVNKLHQRGEKLNYRLSSVKFIRWMALITGLLVIFAEILSHFISLA